MIPWFVIPFLFTLARAFSVSRQPTTGSTTPTCEELQEFWELLSQTVFRTGPETNEIPNMPVRMSVVLDRILQGLSRRGKHSNLYRKYAEAALSSRYDFPDPFTKNPWMVQSPLLPLPNSFHPDTESETFPEPVPPVEGDSGGSFGEFHDLNAPASGEDDLMPGPSAAHESSGPPHFSVPLGDKKNGEREYYIPQWGSLEEVDTFGNFLDFDILSPHLAITRTPRGTTGEWSGFPQDIKNQKSHQIACDGILNSHCSKDEQCFCRGRNNLQCIRGRCLYYGRNSDIAEKYGTWHDGPIPQVQLRVRAMPREKNYKSIFM